MKKEIRKKIPFTIASKVLTGNKPNQRGKRTLQ
jgi:hypothetical protein